MDGSDTDYLALRTTLCEWTLPPLYEWIAAALRGRLEVEGDDVAGHRDALIDVPVDFRLLLVLGKRLDADDDREADDDDAEDEKEELLLTHREGEVSEVRVSEQPSFLTV